MITREHELEARLHQCCRVLETLLRSPDLTLDCLEETTRVAIDRAYEVLDAVQIVLKKKERP